MEIFLLFLANLKEFLEFMLLTGLSNFLVEVAVVLVAVAEAEAVNVLVAVAMIVPVGVSVGRYGSESEGKEQIRL